MTIKEIILALAFLLLMSSATAVGKVWELSSFAYMECDAVSQNLVHQINECNLTSFVENPITINSSVIFNLADGVRPTGVSIWQNYSHTLYHDVSNSINHSVNIDHPYSIVTTTGACDWGAGNIKRNVTMNASNSSSTIYCFDSYINNSNHYTLYSVWNESVSTPYQSSFFDWKDITDKFSVSQFGTYKVGTIEADWTYGQTRRIQFRYDTAPNSKGKFDIAFHLGSAQQAKNNPELIKLYMDPWWDVGFLYRMNISNLTGNISYLNISFTPHMNADFTGRFATDGGVELNYTRESFNSGVSAIFRVQNLNNTQIWYYFGNTTPISDTSNASAVYFDSRDTYYMDDNATTTNVNDAINVLNATAQANTNTMSIAGMIGGALDEQTTDKYITTGTVRLNWSFTIAAWVKNATSGTTSVIHYNANDFFVRYNAATNLTLYSYDGSYASCTNQSQTFNNNNWNYVLATKNNKTSTLYLNGVFYCTASTTNFVNTSAAVGFGGGYTQNAFGYYDEAGLWDRNLSLGEIQALYTMNAPTAVYGPEEAGAPTITFISQSPADISSTNLFAIKANMTYNISDSNSTPLLFFKTNTSTSDISYFVNGTSVEGYQNSTCTNQTALTGTITWLCQADDNDLYPATYNFNQDYMEATAKSAQGLGNNNSYMKMQFFNVSSTRQYSFLELYANNTTATTQPLRIYYCNSSYTANDPATSTNCTLFFSLTAGTPYNHSHGTTEFDYVIPLGLNNATGKIGNVTVTPTSYIMLKGTSGAGGWNVYYITNISRPDAYQTTANSGGSWSNFSGTVASHIHQFSGEDNISYFASVVPSGQVWSGANATNSTLRSDLIELGGIPPSQVQFIVPTENGSYSALQRMMINYTEAISPNSYNISFYNISLLNSDYSFNKSIATNNSANLVKSWVPDVPPGNYVIAVNATDTNGLSSISYQPFILNTSIIGCFNGLAGTTSIPFSGNYTLENDLSSVSTCLELEADNIEIDCAGHSINNSHNGIYPTPAIYAQNIRNGTIRNCEIYNADVGIMAFSYNTTPTTIQIFNTTIHKVQEGLHAGNNSNLAFPSLADENFSGNNVFFYEVTAPFNSSDLTFGHSNILNFAVGYNSTAGIINFTSANITTPLINDTDFILNPDWVSTNSISSGANITFNCTSNLAIYKKTGFPLTRADILANGTLNQVANCIGGYATFPVASFSGYAGEEGTASILNASIANSVETTNSTIVITANNTQTIISYNLTVSYNNTIVLNQTVASYNSTNISRNVSVVAPLVSANNTNISYQVNLSSETITGSSAASVTGNHTIQTYYQISQFAQTKNYNFRIEDDSVINVSIPTMPAGATANVAITPSFGFDYCVLGYSNGTAENTTCTNSSISFVNNNQYTIEASHLYLNKTIYQDSYVNRTYNLSFSQTPESISAKSFSDSNFNASREYFAWIVNSTNQTTDGYSISGASNISTLFLARFYNEITLANLTIDSAIGTYTITFPDGTTKSFIVSKGDGITTAANLTVKAYPNTYTANLSLLEAYSNANYSSRSRILIHSPTNFSTQQNITIYMLPLSASTYAIINVLDGSSPVSNAYVQILKYYASSSSYINIDQKTTDGSGQASAYVQIDAYYKFVVYSSSGALLYSSVAPQQFICTGGECSVTININGGSLSFVTPYVLGNCTGNNATNTISFVYSDSTGATQTINYLAWRLTNTTSNYTNLAAPVCNYTQSGAAGAYNCPLAGGENLSRYAYHCQVQITASPQRAVIDNVIDLRILGFFADWLLAGVILVVGLGCAAISPTVGIISLAIGVSSVAILGIIPLGMEFVIYILLAGGAIAVLLSNRGSD